MSTIEQSRAFTDVAPPSQSRTSKPPVFREPDHDFTAYYAENGFALLGGALGGAEVDEINREAERICRGDLGNVESDRTIDPNLPVELLFRQYLCIHQPHKVSQVAMRVMRQERIVSALTQIIGPNIKAMQSMLFIKAEGKPGQAWHQDEYFIPTRDRSLTAAWIALDDATVENGCLWALSGSHKRGVLYPDRDTTDARFDCSIEAFDFPYADDDAIALEVPAGTALLFNGYLLHQSLPNTSKHGLRRALVNHYMSAESLLPWQKMPAGVRVGNHDYRDIVMVAGTDPYAYKGTVDIARPHSRRDRDGGCDR